MAKILSVKKVVKGSVILDEKILDYLFLNEGDYLAFVEENNKIFIRKTNKPDKTDSPQAEEVPPPPTFEEQSKEFSNQTAFDPNNLLNSIQDALKNPEMMKMFQDTAKQIFSAFGNINPMDPNATKSPNKTKKSQTDEDDDNEDDDSDNDEEYYDDGDDDDDSDSDNQGFKVKID